MGLWDNLLFTDHLSWCSVFKILCSAVLTPRFGLCLYCSDLLCYRTPSRCNAWAALQIIQVFFFFFFNRFWFLYKIVEVCFTDSFDCKFYWFTELEWYIKKNPLIKLKKKKENVFCVENIAAASSNHMFFLTDLCCFVKCLAKLASIMCSECAPFSFALVFAIIACLWLPLLFHGLEKRSSFLHASTCLQFPLLFGSLSRWPRLQQKMTPPPFTLLTEEWFIVASFGVLSALTLCYMIIRATSSSPTYEWVL